METNYHPDERAEERWTEVFEKVFADVRANHPADEWTLRVVDRLSWNKTPEVIAVEPLTISPTEEEIVQELMMLEQLGVTALEESPPPPVVGDKTDGWSERGIDVIQLQHCSLLEDETAKEFTVLEKAVSDVIPIEPVHQVIVGNSDDDQNTLTSSPEAALCTSTDDDHSDNSTLIANVQLLAFNTLPAEQCEPIEQSLSVTNYDDEEKPPANDEKPELIESHEVAAPEQLEAQQDDEAQGLCDQDKGEKLARDKSETTENDSLQQQEGNNGVEAEQKIENALVDNTTLEQQPENVAQNSSEQESEPAPVPPEIPNENQDLVSQSAQESPPKVEEEVCSNDAVEPSAVSAQILEIQSTNNQLEIHLSPPEVADQPDAETAEAQVSVVEIIENPESNKSQNDVETNNDNTQALDKSSRLGAFNHDGSVSVYEEPPKQVEEIEVKPVQLEQPQEIAEPASLEEVVKPGQLEPPQSVPSAQPVVLHQSSPHLEEIGRMNGDGQINKSTSSTTEATSTLGKKPPNSPQPSRKPEWMRRPLVRKGSVGRFLGRMRETMQSKRFHPEDRPGNVGKNPRRVPPPEPEPPKRPPRRKTLANLDLNRESVTAAREQSQLDSSPPPKSAPVAPSETENSSKSATLRSSTSERKRKNSVGRLAASAASRIGRALSTKQLNTTEAEEAPLLQQDVPKEPPTTPSTPSQPPPRSPSPDKSIKKDPVFGQFIRRIDRILRPKTPTTEEVKIKPAPERPPPPVPVKDTQEKPIIKNGKVQFECHKCHHQWSSAKGTVKFEILMNQVGEGIRQGEILVQLYGQRCNSCTANVFETAQWSLEGIEKALNGLRLEVGRRFYPDDQPVLDERGPRAHQRALCQACQEGVCQKKSAR